MSKYESSKVQTVTNTDLVRVQEAVCSALGLWPGEVVSVEVQPIEVTVVRVHDFGDVITSGTHASDSGVLLERIKYRLRQEDNSNGRVQD